MSALAAARARYDANKFEARRQAALTLVPSIGVDFAVLGWAAKIRQAYVGQWGQVDRSQTSANWDWPEIFRRYNDPDRFDMAIWCNDRLSALALAVTTGQATVLKFVEGDPRPDCPLIGRRLLIILESLANYTQARGKVEMRVEPANPALETLYIEKYGFTLETPRGGRAYYKKAV
jgi:hypothetical protein